jgi:hypothetical protein
MIPFFYSAFLTLSSLCYPSIFVDSHLPEPGIVQGLPVPNENLNLGGDHERVRQEPNQRQGGMVLELKHELLRVNAELWAGRWGGGW